MQVQSDEFLNSILREYEWSALLTSSVAVQDSPQYPSHTRMTVLQKLCESYKEGIQPHLSPYQGKYFDTLLHREAGSYHKV